MDSGLASLHLVLYYNLTIIVCLCTYTYLDVCVRASLYMCVCVYNYIQIPVTPNDGSVLKWSLLWFTTKTQQFSDGLFCSVCFSF
jgi:hypothetical protein